MAGGRANLDSCVAPSPTSCSCHRPLHGSRSRHSTEPLALLYSGDRVAGHLLCPWYRRLFQLTGEWDGQGAECCMSSSEKRNDTVVDVSTVEPNRRQVFALL